MKIFRKEKGEKDKDKEKEKDKLDTSHGISKEQASIRTRTSTSSPLLQSSTVRRESGDHNGSLGRSQATNSDVKKSHAIRIGDTRFYGRIICRAKALYDYPLDGDTLQVEDEEIKLLKFKKGDIINVYEQDTSGWWAGEFNDEKGIFPGSYMRVLEDEPAEQPKNKDKAKSQTVAREELLNTISSLEVEREDLLNQQERDRAEFNRTIKELKAKSEAEIQELKRMLAERDETIQASAKKCRAVEMELDEVTTKIAAKEVEVMTMELEIQEYKIKIPELLAKQQETNTKRDERNSPQLKSVQAEINAKNAELQEILRQKQEAERGVRDAKAKLNALESQILRKVMTSPIQDPPTPERVDDIDMLKKQLGEEVFEKRRMENEIREMKRLCVDVENLKIDKARLEVELASKAELENKLAKIDTILLGVISKDNNGLTVTSMKELLSKVRKGIASRPTNGLKSSSVVTGGLGGSSGLSSNSSKLERTSTRPKTTFFSDT